MGSKNLVGKTAVVEKLGASIVFGAKGVKEALNQPHKNIQEKNAALMNIVELLEQGEYISSKLDDKGNPMVLQYHYIKIDIYGIPSYAVIREMMDGRFVFYSIVEKLKKEKND